MRRSRLLLYIAVMLCLWLADVTAFDFFGQFFDKQSGERPSSHPAEEVAPSADGTNVRE